MPLAGVFIACIAILFIAIFGIYILFDVHEPLNQILSDKAHHPKAES